MAEPTLVSPPAGGLRRVVRLSDADTFPDPPQAAEDDGDRLLGRRRFEDPRGEFGVLYCASTAEAAYGDDIAQHRPRVVGGRPILALVSEFFSTGPDSSDPEPGVIPHSYFDDRVKVALETEAGACCVDLDDPMTHVALDAGLSHVLERLGLGNFDRGVIMGADRRVTGAIARYFYSTSQRPGGEDIIGLTYQSRFAADWQRWAIWDPTRIYLADEPSEPVTRDDPDLLRAANRLGIRVPGLS